MWQTVERRFADDHPTAAGHFPGNPIIPGAVLLDEVMASIGAAEYDGAVTTIRSAKFLRPVSPGEAVRVRWRPLPDGAISFECRMKEDDALAVAGALMIVPVQA
jgi:3-hydroxymyristoyl/3-hydroxydecanoyl-(acyl carrier protein) dehydratase